MRSNYNQVRTLAYRISPDITDLPFSCHVVAFPEPWKQALLPLQRTQTDRSEDAVSLPVYALNACLLAVCPDILHIARGVGKLNAPTPWIYGLQPIPAQTLRDLVALWVHYTYSKVPAERRAEVIAALDPTALVWREHTVDLATWSTTEGGTAQEHDQSQYALLAQLAAATLCAPPIPLMHGPERLTFQRAAPAPGKNSARLVAWPPLHYEDDAYSPFLTLATHTVAFQPHPQLHIDYGLIRWVGTPHASLPGGRTSIFLRSTVPWISGVLPSAHFQAAQVRWRNENGRFRLVWDGMLAELLAQVDMPEIVDPNDLVADPQPFLKPNEAFNAAIVYRNGMRVEQGRKPLKHAVSVGFGPADRARMAEQLAEALAPTFSFTPELPRVERKSPAVQVAFNNPFGLKLAKSTDDMDEEQLADVVENNAPLQSQRRAYLNRIAQGQPFVLEIWYQENSTIATLRSVLAEEFGLDITADTSRWSTPEAMIELRTLPFDSRARPLPVTRRSQAHRDAINARAEEIRTWLEDKEKPTCTLMELAGADRFEDNTDPRPALRMGAALAGRITQQIRPPMNKEDQKNHAHRLRMALLDAIRQCGRQPQPVTTSGALSATDDSSSNLVGIWLIKTYAKHSPTGQTAHIPFVVLLPADDDRVLCRAPGWDDWRPYAEGLLALARNDATSYPKVRDAARFIATTIEEDLTALGGSSIVMVMRRNLSEAWPYIANKHLVADHIRFGSEDLRPIRDLPGLRLLRLRDATDQETAEWFARDGAKASVTKGLFRIGERVFASTYGRPKQFKISPEQSKTQAYQVRHPKTGEIITKEADPSAYSWNPGIVEVTVAAMQRGDDPARLAFVPHILRAQAVHFDEALALPLPLHLAKLAQEYVIPIGYDREDNGEARQLSLFSYLE